MAIRWVIFLTCLISIAHSVPLQVQDEKSPSGTEPKAILNFQLSANNIADKDGWPAGQSDPFVKVYHNRGGGWVNFGRSETIIDNLNPTWGYVFTDSGFVPGSGQKWWIEIRDHDTAGTDDPVGDAEILVDDYYNDADKIMTVPLIGGGSVTIKQATRKTDY